MFSLIPWYWRWAALAAMSAALWGHGFVTGARHEGDRRDVQDAQALAGAVNLGNRISGRLAQQNAKTNAKTQEVLRNVPKVTADRPCLSAGAVGLLNGTPPRLHEATWKPVDPAPAAPATDRDVAAWIARAKGQYQTVADQLNALIDYTQGKETSEPETDEEEIEP